jgi:DNA-binding response OmpR family regulator
LEKEADILIVEDDVNLAEITKDFLEANGYRVLSCTTGGAAIDLAKATTFKLIVLDINLPDLMGFHVCSIIRRASKVPIIFTSARITEADKVRGLELGADDYVTKPYSLNELLARIRVLMRRTYDYDADADTAVKPKTVEAVGQERSAADGSRAHKTFLLGPVEIDLTDRKVRVAGTEKELTDKEFDLLAYLNKNRNKSISNETLVNEVWGYDSSFDINTLSIHIRKLREQVEEDASDPKFIKTVRSFGYRFEV